MAVHFDSLIHGPPFDLQCLNGSQLLVNFGLSPVAPLTPRQFALLCPALLYQIDSRVCIKTPAPAPPGDALSGQWMSGVGNILVGRGSFAKRGLLGVQLPLSVSVHVVPLYQPFPNIRPD